MSVLGWDLVQSCLQEHSLLGREAAPALCAGSPLASSMCEYESLLGQKSCAKNDCFYWPVGCTSIQFTDNLSEVTF